MPLVSVMSGCLFADWGSDLGSGASVIGNPAGQAGGGGVRVCSWTLCACTYAHVCVGGGGRGGEACVCMCA